MVAEAFRRGLVIPAHPLALDANRALDERRQRALTRYYVDAGAGGLAIGVHTTQFEIHDRTIGLLQPVLELAVETARSQAGHGRPIFMIAGVIGPSSQVIAEATMARDLGYDAVLLGPAAGLDEDALIARATTVGEVLPVIGFYLQPAVGGRVLSREFWARLAAIDTVIGIKVAPFNRYRTLDVIHGVAASGRADRVSLYTGNDDHIALDLAARFRLAGAHGEVDLRFVGGLLGQWAVWTSRAVELLDDARRSHEGNVAALQRILAVDAALTDANGALFDVANDYAGCIAGIHEVLRRHGLLTGRWCLNPDEDVSPGQLSEIDRIWATYPDLRDDAFIAENLDRWLA